MPEASSNDIQISAPVLTIGGTKAQPELTSRVKELSGQNLSTCYQCGECTAGCPAAFAMDLTPNQIVRMAQLGMEDVLSSKSIWMCAGCETCVTRCPNDVHLSRIMDSLRQIATARGIRCPESSIKQFHDTFLEAIESGGRVHEVSMIARLKMRTRNFFTDVPLGMQMFRQGKLPIKGHKVRDTESVRKLFRAAREHTK